MRVVDDFRQDDRIDDRHVLDEQPGVFDGVEGNVGFGHLAFYRAAVSVAEVAEVRRQFGAEEVLEAN